MKRLAAAFLACLLPNAQAAPTLDLTVRLDPAARTLEARATLADPEGLPRELHLAPEFAIDKASLDGQPVTLARAFDGGFTLPRAARRLTLSYSGSLSPLGERDHRGTLGGLPNMADPRGSFLPAGGGWYPHPGTPFAYTVKLALPAGQVGLVPGRVSEESREGGYSARFDFPHPAEGIDLMAGPYQVEERLHAVPGREPIRLRTYFPAGMADLAPGYLDSVTGYIDLYRTRIGDYLYSEFSVVSSPLPTGFGMPTLTYLGEQVLRLPFIRFSSLGHEVLHNWWGNGVYPDYGRGNWSEGLTTLGADYAYKEAESPAAARSMRLDWLRDLAALEGAADAPLGRFVSRTHGASQIVGYSKAAFFLFSLRERLGPAFDEGLKRFYRDRQFRVSTWDDLRASLEAASGQDLQRSFSEWLGRTGVPAPRVESARARREGGAWRLSLVLAQDAPAWDLLLPITVETAAGTETRALPLSAMQAKVEIDLPAEPLAVLLDPDFRLPRRLAPGEAPPVLRQAMVLRRAPVLLADGPGPMAEAVRALAPRLFDAAPVYLEAGDASAPALLAGTPPAVAAALGRLGLARPADLPRRGSGAAYALSLRGAPLMVVEAADPEAMAALARPLPHYGRQGWVAFEGGKALDRGALAATPQRTAVVRED